MTSLIAVTSHVVTPWALSHSYCWEENLFKWQPPPSNQSHPAKEEDEFPASKTPTLCLNYISGRLAGSLPPSSSIGGQKVMLILLLGTLMPANFHSLVSSARQPNHSCTSPKGTEAVKILSIKGTEDFLLPISPKSSSALMFLESLLFWKLFLSDSF